ncbi:hypothetical protein PENTCL1PPCAC_26196, partial [Pristionchus entomophagus]
LPPSFFFSSPIVSFLFPIDLPLNIHTFFYRFQSRMALHSPSPRPSPTHVPSFKCPSCEAVFLDTIDSLINHFDSVHNGREFLYSKLSPLTLERIFAIVHNSFVSSCRLPYSTPSTSGEHSSGDFPFPA